jgi:hypothetical protein
LLTSTSFCQQSAKLKQLKVSHNPGYYITPQQKKKKKKKKIYQPGVVVHAYNISYSGN